MWTWTMRSHWAGAKNEANITAGLEWDMERQKVPMTLFQSGHHSTWDHLYPGTCNCMAQQGLHLFTSLEPVWLEFPVTGYQGIFRHTGQEFGSWFSLYSFLPPLSPPALFSLLCKFDMNFRFLEKFQNNTQNPRHCLSRFPKCWLVEVFVSLCTYICTTHTHVIFFWSDWE